MDRPPKSKSVQRLQRLLDAIRELQSRPRGSSEFEKWRRDTAVAISNTFPDRPGYQEDFVGIRYRPRAVWSGMSESEYQRAYVGGLQSAAASLASMVDEIREYWEDDEPAATPTATAREQQTTNEVFVVHGTDEGAKDAVARLLTKLDLEPVVLHEQPNQGRTIIEKFEEYAQVGFAVVLLTPDDEGGSRGQSTDPQPRARQNVILELGFFLGKLGRRRTCALRKEDVEIPSDYDGVLYIPMDDQGAWELKLLRELKEGGFDVDANRLLAPHPPGHH